MFNKKQRVLMFVLLLAGLVVALKLVHIDYMVNYSGTPFKSFCNISAKFNCDAVAASEYSHLLGMPIALVGAVANLFLMIFLQVGSGLALLRERMKQLYLWIFCGYGVGIIYLAMVTLVATPALCLLCMCYWLIGLVTLGYLWSINRSESLAIGDLGRAIRGHGVIVATFGVTFLLVLFGVKAAIFAKKIMLVDAPVEMVSSGVSGGFNAKTFEAYLGNGNATLEVYVYTDFQCPWCKHSHGNVVKLAESFAGKVRFIRRDFPLDQACNKLVGRSMHPIACVAAYYAKCAGVQGKYWQFHDELYANQERLSLDELKRIAADLKLEAAALDECLVSEAVKSAVVSDVEEAGKYSVGGTPTFRIGDKIYEGNITETDINEQLKK
ncbi:MAG: thioredoxin domain-containing protein [Oligoflexia bacterium]|nr:thioredoxin domain-containing protein [Oligoflexia bacterium]